MTNDITVYADILDEMDDSEKTDFIKSLDLQACPGCGAWNHDNPECNDCMWAA